MRRVSLGTIDFSSQKGYIWYGNLGLFRVRVVYAINIVELQPNQLKNVRGISPLSHFAHYYISILFIFVKIVPKLVNVHIRLIQIL
jgi:hypothetical protein